MKKIVVLLICVCSCVAGFGQFGFGAYNSKSADADAKEVCNTHKKIAILPFQTNFDQSSISGKAGKKEQAMFDNNGYSKECQQYTYDYMMKLRERKEVDIALQTPAETNAIMEKAGVSLDSLLSMEYTEVCKFLGVDAAIKGYVDVDKYMSKGGAVAMGMFAGGAPPNEQVDVSLSILDGATGRVIWYFESTVDGSLFSKAEKLVNALMANVGRKLPYFKKK